MNRNAEDRSTTTEITVIQVSGIATVLTAIYKMSDGSIVVDPYEYVPHDPTPPYGIQPNMPRLTYIPMGRFTPRSGDT
jgi:hypothetical protein